MSTSLIDDLRNCAESLALSKNPNPVISSLLFKAAAALEDSENDCIIMTDNCGNEIARIDGELASFVKQQAVSIYIQKILTDAIQQYQN